MATVEFSYNGSDTVIAVITGATPTEEYRLYVDDGDLYPEDTETAVGTELTLQVSTASPAAGLTFAVYVQVSPGMADRHYIGGTCFQQGTTTEYAFAATWAFDGVDTVTVTGTFTNGVDYVVQTVDNINGGQDQPFTGTGASQLVTHVLPAAPGGTYFIALVVQDVTGASPTGRLFTPGVAGEGTFGSVEGDVDTGQEGVRIAFDDTTLQSTPTWTRLDSTHGFVAGYTIRRGRQTELEQTDTGTATIELNDISGVVDPTNTGGPHFGDIQPGKQAALALRNPVTDTWTTLFRGHVDDFRYEIHPSQVVTRVQVALVDAFDFLSRVEVVPGLFGNTLPTEVEAGNVYYDEANVDDRIFSALGDAGWPVDLSTIFSGNVVVRGTIYDPGTSILTILKDAADAEFPTVANVYVSKDGKVTFHGRLARFDPEGVAAGATPGAWNFTRWKAGDGAAIALDADTAQIRSFSFARPARNIINHALAMPQEIAEADIAGQLVTDTDSINEFGRRAWTAPDLLTLEGTTTGLTDPLDETKLFAQYMVQNFKDPRNRIERIVLRSIQPDDPRAEATWALICGVEISDVVTVTVSHPGGGGIDEDFYVEGLTYDVRELNGEYQDVTLALDLSPAAYFATDPFSGT